MAIKNFRNFQGHLERGIVAVIFQVDNGFPTDTDQLSQFLLADFFAFRYSLRLVMILAILTTSLFKEEKGKVKSQNHGGAENQDHASLESEWLEEGDDSENHQAKKDKAQGQASGLGQIGIEAIVWLLVHLFKSKVEEESHQQEESKSQEDILDPARICSGSDDPDAYTIDSHGTKECHRIEFFSQTKIECFWVWLGKFGEEEEEKEQVDQKASKDAIFYPCRIRSRGQKPDSPS